MATKFQTVSGSLYIIDDEGETLTRLAEHPVFSESLGDYVYEPLRHELIKEIKLLEEGSGAQFELECGSLRTSIVDKIESL